MLLKVQIKDTLALARPVQWKLKPILYSWSRLCFWNKTKQDKIGKNVDNLKAQFRLLKRFAKEIDLMRVRTRVFCLDFCRNIHFLNEAFLYPAHSVLVLAENGKMHNTKQSCDA